MQYNKIVSFQGIDGFKEVQITIDADEIEAIINMSKTIGSLQCRAHGVLSIGDFKPMIDGSMADSFKERGMTFFRVFEDEVIGVIQMLGHHGIQEAETRPSNRILVSELQRLLQPSTAAEPINCEQEYRDERVLVEKDPA